MKSKDKLKIGDMFRYWGNGKFKNETVSIIDIYIGSICHKGEDLSVPFIQFSESKFTPDLRLPLSKVEHLMEQGRLQMIFGI